MLDAAGGVIRSFESPAKPGLNRTDWNLRRDGPKVPTATGTTDSPGPEVLPGTYSVRITMGDAQASGTVEVRPDPRLDVPQSEREAKYAALMRVQQRTEVATEAVVRLRATGKAVDAVLERAESLDETTAQALEESGTALKGRLEEVSATFIDPPNRGQGIFGSSTTVSSQLRRAASSLRSSWDAPTQAQRLTLELAEAALDAALDQLNQVFAEDVAAFREQARAAELALIPDYEALSLDWRRER